MATTVSAFNDMMQQFLDELVLTFPEEKSFRKFQANFQLLRKTNPRSPLNSYMESITPYVNSIMQRDEAFFKDNSKDIPFLTQINIKGIWTDELAETTKNTIWQYLQTMYIIGTTIMSLPPETLSMIESVAQKCADEMTETGGTSEEVLMKNMSGLMASLLGSQPKK